MSNHQWGVHEQWLALAHRLGLLLDSCPTLASVFIAVSTGYGGRGQRKRVTTRDPLVEQITKKLGVIVARHGLTELCRKRGSPRVDLIARDRGIVTGLVQPTGGESISAE